MIICGGDGTLNRFVNDVKGLQFSNKVLYYACGSGNDFLRDIPHDEGKPVAFNEYMENLPTVLVNGKEYVFLNGVGYGIDGYCCEVGDKLRAEKPGQNINYAGIAIKGLLFHYKPTNATVIVDGKEYAYKKVWLAPTMYGRYYGGGMLPAPEQRRGQDNVSVMLFHGSGKLKTLMIFPSLFKGEHVKHTKNIAVFSGKEITVKFDTPRTLQIDGETVFDVSEYTVRR
jgi:diacylglycerol kinase family enzyme